MNRADVTMRLSRLVEGRISRTCPLWAPEVDVPVGDAGTGRVDFMGFTPYGHALGYEPDASSMERGVLSCYEVKSCMADFESGHGLNFVGDENWLVCPRDLCERLRERMRLPRVAGVLCPDAGWKRLLEVIHQPPGAYRYRRQMTAAEAIWRIAKESYGARYESEEGGC